MKKTIIILALFSFMLGGCSDKRNDFLGGLDKLKWHSDVSDVKTYMENQVKAEYSNYKINRNEKTLSMFFKGAEFAGVKVESWELKTKEGKFFEYIIRFPSENKNYERILKTLEAKLGRPNITEEAKAVWKKTSPEHADEKIVLRKFSDAVVLTAEAVED